MTQEEKEKTHKDNKARHERRDNVARTRRDIEAVLILEGAPTKGDSAEEKEAFDAYVLRWLERNTKPFRAVYDELYGEMIDIVAEWRTNREALLKEIRSRLSKLTKG
jgi:hypothetical protein